MAHTHVINEILGQLSLRRPGDYLLNDMCHLLYVTATLAGNVLVLDNHGTHHLNQWLHLYTNQPHLYNEVWYFYKMQ